MAAEEPVAGYRADVEATVNRWIVDYYSFVAMEAFKSHKYEEFREIGEVLESVLHRPHESTDVMPTKILVLTFLTRINDGENLDICYDADTSETPLESALIVLEKMMEDCSSLLPQQDFQKVQTSLREMMVAVFIKNSNFNKAKEVINKHFPKPMVGKKAVFMHLIQKKLKNHEVIDQMDFKRFKSEMFDFCQSLSPVSVPFLHKAAIKLIGRRNMEQDDQENGAGDPGEEIPAGLKTNPVHVAPSNRSIIQRSRLEAAFNALADGSEDKTFSQLEEEVEEESQTNKDSLRFSQSLYLRLSPSPKDLEQDGHFQRDSESPMEATPADQLQTHTTTTTRLRSRLPNTVSRLVVEPDSQGSSQCSASSQEVDNNNQRTAENHPPSTPTQPTSDPKESESPITDPEVPTPKRRLPRRNTKSCSRTSSRSVSEENSLDSVEGKHRNKSTTSSRRRSARVLQESSDSEEDPFDFNSSQSSAGKPQSTLNMMPKTVCVNDSSLDSSEEATPTQSDPQKSSTPQKTPQKTPKKTPQKSKWKRLYDAAKHSKETWSDEESYFTAKNNNTASHNESSSSNSTNRKRKWTEAETNNLKEGIKRFGEGNWAKIKAYYSFNERTNVNLKDRWRTLKTKNLV